MTTRNFPERTSIQTHVGIEIAKHYNFELTNIARGGRGMDRTTLTTMIFFEKHRKFKDTFALIEWSDAGRWDYPTRFKKKKHLHPQLDTDWSTIKLTDEATTTFFNKNAETMDLPGFLVTRFYHNVLSLQSFFKSNGIPYLMYNGIWNSIDEGKKDHQSLSNLVDKKHFFGFGDYELSHCNWCARNKLCVGGGDEHPNEEGHKEFAKLLISYINENNLLKKYNL